MSDQMNEREKIFSDGSRHIELYCRKCGRNNGYKSQNKPITEEYAMHFKLNFGKYKGLELQNVDDDYLNWMCDFTQYKHLAKVFKAERSRRQKIWDEMKDSAGGI
jgi:hypothetical protein